MGLSYHLKKKIVSQFLLEKIFTKQSHKTVLIKKDRDMEKEHSNLFYLDRYSELSQFSQVGRSLNNLSFNNFRTNASFFDASIPKSDVDPFKNVRYSSEHGCLTMSFDSPSSSSSTSFLCDLSLNLVRGNAHIPELYTRDLISTIGSRDHYSVNLIPKFGGNSSNVNDSKDWGLDLSLQM